MAHQELIKTPIEIFRHKTFYSNCHGTVLFVLGQEDYLAASKWKDKDDWSKKQGRPSSVAKWVMKDFLENRCRQVNAPKIGDIITFWGGSQNNTLAHSAMLCESSNGSSKIFHQKNTKEPFGIVGLKKIIRFYYPNEKKFFELKN